MQMRTLGRAGPKVSAVGALRVSLSPEEVAALERAVPADAVAGERYAPAAMATLDSERRTRASTS